MLLEAGNYVVYRSAEICRIEGFEKKCLDGVSENEYCVLTPVGSPRSRYYIPSGIAGDRLRGLISRGEILGMIDSMAHDSVPLTGGAAKRNAEQGEVLADSDYLRIASMLHSLYLEKQRVAQGKKLPAADERAMRSAEAIINSEFSFVLGIPETEVQDFILQRLGGGKPE